MKNRFYFVRASSALALAAWLGMASTASAAETVWLSSLDLAKMRQEKGAPQVDKSFAEKPLSIGKKAFAQGVGTYANSTVHVALAGGCEAFLATVGVDDNAGPRGSVIFKIYADGKKLWDSGVMKTGQAPKPVEVKLQGMKKLVLVVDSAGDTNRDDSANWAEARFVVTGAKPQTVDLPREEAVIMTPKPGPAPRINGPKVYGARPGNPFLFRIPTTGQRPIAFAAAGLPAGLTLDKASGIISGTTPARGEYVVTLSATNAVGKAERKFKIVSGDTLALTPTMGWNHWYAHYARITDKMMREAADLLLSTGMADAGYDYVDIDDCWMNIPAEKATSRNDPLRVGPMRDARGNIVPNKHFPDMKALTDYIHSKGLKAGTYTSPGPLTCEGFAGSYQHEAQDAQQFAEWGFDLLKYDWCSYGRVAPAPRSLESMQMPYRLMGGLLKEQKRDIVYNLCQYGMGDVWKWGAEVGGHSWRTAGDLGLALDRIFTVAVKNAGYREWQKPGAWNDPDYLQIGYIGNARGNGLPEPCPLSPNEQYAFLSLWSLMSAPLIYSGDMTRLDEFTLNVLCNSEVIDVNQDPLGQCAAVVSQVDEAFVMVKKLEDGTKAIGLCNGGEMETTMTAKWSELGVSGKQILRDIWRQQDIGTFEGEYQTLVPRHAVVFLKVRPAK